MEIKDFTAVPDVSLGNRYFDMSVVNVSGNILIGGATQGNVSQFPEITTSGNEIIVMQKSNLKKLKRVSFAENEYCTAVQDYLLQHASGLFVGDLNGTEICGAENRSANSSKVCPNILKKTAKKEQCLQDPIQKLPFSPSRFLNASVGATSSSSLANITKDLNLSLVSHADDSGIENVTCTDADSLFSLPSLTSTPICKKSHRLLTPSRKNNQLTSPQKLAGALSTSCISASCESLVDNCVTNMQLDSGADTIFKTPLIRRYLNESVPFTPTPFKCGSIDEENDSNYNTRLSTSILRANTDKDEVNFCLTSSPTVRVLGESSRSRNLEKKARKSLVLDRDWSKPSNPLPPREDFPLAVRLSDAYKASDPVGFVTLEPLLTSKGKIRTQRLSGLLDKRTVVKRLSKKSFITSSRKFAAVQSVKSFKLDKKWVAIACGQTEDQKSMTHAAKKYLAKVPARSKLVLSNAILKKNSYYNNSRIR